MKSEVFQGSEVIYKSADSDNSIFISLPHHFRGDSSTNNNTVLAN